MNAEYYQYTIQKLDTCGWCCWVSWGGRTKHCVENCTSATEALAKAMLWAEAYTE